MIRFLDDPEACLQPKNSTLSELIYGWGNEAWSAREEYLTSCIAHALAAKGAILECGSGLTTLLVAAIAKKQGQPHWILEHKPHWAKKAQQYLDIYQLDSIVCSKPLKDYGDYCWYEVPMDNMPHTFSLLICDGPPRRTKGGRYGLIPVMRKQIQSGCVILLDDGYRQEEVEIAKRWAMEINSSYCIQGIAKPYIVMTVE
jgi:hypothetical protein